MTTTLRTIYAVSELAETLRALVEQALPRVWVEGEISNLSRPASGHWYFTLKDENAQIRCAMFRNANRLVRPIPANGDRVLLRASVGYYVARGDLQLICEHLEAAGEGALLREFEALKRRLSAEGLFDPARKRAIPRVPRHIGLITSATGAALQDVRTAIARRFPLVATTLHPVPVQGNTSAPAIAAALRELPQRAAVDVILLVRGGGSLEDLWSFNEEIVARAIVACPVPVVSGVGHETDTTIADFVADLRAATPTAAAELVTPDQSDYRRAIRSSLATLKRTMATGLQTRQQGLSQLFRRLERQNPERLIQQRAQRVDETAQRLEQAMRAQLRNRRLQLAGTFQRLQSTSPGPAIKRRRQALQEKTLRMDKGMQSHLAIATKRLEHRLGLLQALNPESVLQRGYAIARLDSGQVLRRAADAPGDSAFELILAEDRLRVIRKS